MVEEALRYLGLMVEAGLYSYFHLVSSSNLHFHHAVGFLKPTAFISAQYFSTGLY